MSNHNNDILRVTSSEHRRSIAYSLEEHISIFAKGEMMAPVDKVDSIFLRYHDTTPA